MFARKLHFLFLLLFTFFTYSAQAKGSLTFTAWLTGAEEVPAVVTDAKGVASFRLSENRDSLVIMALATGLSGPITGAAILESRRGTTGGALRTLELMQVGNKFYGVLTGTDLPAAMLAKMLNGETYINIFTSANPNGEIRGQIELEKDYSMQAALTGTEVVPAVNTTAFGVASIRMSLDKKHVHIKAQFTEINSITGVHLAMGSSGSNGSNVMDLTSYLSGNRIAVTVPVADIPLLEEDSLLEEKIYIYATSNTYPDGEIRGQLQRVYGLGFEADMNGAQEVPSVSTSGRGLGIFRLNNKLDTLTYHIVFSNLSSDVTGAHLHLGKPGETGSIVIDISDSVSGNTIKGQAYGVDITKAVISAMIRGDIYVNVHTKNHTSGEIRGQLKSGLRTTYSFDLCGQQETPAVTTIAMGVGIVSVDQDTSNLHYKIVADSLSSEITGAHFHKAKIGEAGDVVLPISFQHNAAYGFLGDTSSAPMVLILAKDIAAENIYVNIHTSNHTGGEIRGQVVARAICSQVIGVAENTMLGAQIAVYPLPFSNTFTVEIDALQSDNYTVSLYDMQGKQISTNNTYIHFGKNTLEINAADGKSGLYMLQVTDEKGRSYSQKILRY